MSKRWFVRNLGLKHRFMVNVPVAFVEIAEGTVKLLTLGFIQPGWSLRLAVRQAIKYSRQRQGDKS